MSVTLERSVEIVKTPHQVKYPVKITKAMFIVSEEANVLVREFFNEQGGYEYVSIDQYYKDIAPILAKHGLKMVCNLVDSRVITIDGKEIFDAEVLVDLIYKDGTCIKSIITFPMHHPYMEAQGNASMNSFAKKIAFRNLFDIATREGDSDQYGGGSGGGKRRGTKRFIEAGGLDRAYAADGNVPVVQPNPNQMAAQFSQAPASQRPLDRQPVASKAARTGRSDTNDERFEVNILVDCDACMTVRAVNDLYRKHKSTLNRLQSDDNKRYNDIIAKLAARKKLLSSNPPDNDPPSRPEPPPQFEYQSYDPHSSPDSYGGSYHGSPYGMNHAAPVAPPPPSPAPRVATTKTDAPRRAPIPFPRQAPPPKGPNVVALFPPQPGKKPRSAVTRPTKKRSG